LAGGRACAAAASGPADLAWRSIVGGGRHSISMPRKSEYDRWKLNRILDNQFSVIGRYQALDCGLSDSAINHRLRADGPWRKLLPGVYAATTGAPTQQQRAMAALVHVSARGVITGATAVRLQGLQCAGPDDRIEVLVSPEVRVQGAGFVQVTITTRMPARIYTIKGLRYALPARAVADSARAMTRLSDVRAVVATAVQRDRCSLEELVAELKDGPSRGSRLLRIALYEVGDGIRSAAEGDLRDLIGKSDLEQPEYNVALYAPDGTFLGIADVWWRRAGVVGEVDSVQYHLSPDDYRRTTMRHNRMAAHSINVLHFLPASIKSDGDTILKNLADAIAAGKRNPPLPIIAIPAGERLAEGLIR
jgi:hypothetical protein